MSLTFFSHGNTLSNHRMGKVCEALGTIPHKKTRDIPAHDAPLYGNPFIDRQYREQQLAIILKEELNKEELNNKSGSKPSVATSRCHEMGIIDRLTDYIRTTFLNLTSKRETIKDACDTFMVGLEAEGGLIIYPSWSKQDIELESHRLMLRGAAMKGISSIEITNEHDTWSYALTTSNGEIVRGKDLPYGNRTTYNAFQECALVKMLAETTTAELEHSDVQIKESTWLDKIMKNQRQFHEVDMHRDAHSQHQALRLRLLALFGDFIAFEPEKTRSKYVEHISQYINTLMPKNNYMYGYGSSDVREIFQEAWAEIHKKAPENQANAYSQKEPIPSSTRATLALLQADNQTLWEIQRQTPWCRDDDTLPKIREQNPYIPYSQKSEDFLSLTTKF